MRLADRDGRHALPYFLLTVLRTGLACAAAATVLGGMLAVTMAAGAYGQRGGGTPGVQIAMAHDPADPAPGEPLTYAVWLTNDSDSEATGYQVTTHLPGAVMDVTWTCRALGHGSACGTAAGAGEVDDVADVGAEGGAVVYTIFATVDPERDHVSLTATATVTPPPAGACDPCEAGTTAGEVPTVHLRKTYHPRDPGPAPGEALAFTITLTNDSSVDATGYAIDGPLPAEFVDVTWTCRATGAGSACGAREGTGRLLDVADVGAGGGTVVYILTGTVDPDASGEPFRQHVTLVPGPGQACEPMVATTRSELDYYRSSYGAPPVAEAMMCRTNNLVEPATHADQTTESLANTGSYAVAYVIAGCAAILGGVVLVRVTRRRSGGPSTPSAPSAPSAPSRPRGKRRMATRWGISSRRGGGTAIRRP
jgi:uncharacterized repeat protein (TIGR01451 family)